MNETDWPETMELFVDRTGLPGPRDWTGQRFPSGKANHPVTGVSWFEASAYCRFRGSRLPTFYEWEKTARDGEISRIGVVMPWGYLDPKAGGHLRANFSSDGTLPVDAHPFGISSYGAYDMAGNVKEWLSNRVEAGRAVTGGSWEDPIYLFTEVGSLDPFAASPSLGFRCARLAEDPARASRADQGAGPLPLAMHTPQYEPVDEATFRLLLAHYRYDRRPVNGQIVERVEGPGWTREKIVYDGPGGSSVPAYLYLPVTAQPPYQTLVYVPGSNAFWGVSIPDATERLLEPVIRSGRAVLAVVMDGMTEREWPPDFQPPEPSTVQFRDLMVRHATELRMGIDYLETREDIDPETLAYVGLSWGAGSRLVFAAVDERLRSVILVGGGIDERVHPTLPEASNINFAPRIKGPTLLLNGRQDEEHPWLTRGLPLWNLLSEPKELILAEDAGHVPPPEIRVPAMIEWLDQTLGPVRR